MSKRSAISPTKRARIFLNANGKCHLCGRKIAEGEPWEVEHPKALGLGGKDDESNMTPAHVDCHAGKSRADFRIMRKADRQMKKAAGIKRSSHPMPGGRGSKFKKKMNGKVVER